MTDAPGRRRITLVVYCAVLFLTIIDVTVVNVALPGIGEDLGVEAGLLAGVSVAYLVALSVSLPTAGWLADRFGDARILLAAIVVFTLGSLGCGLSPDIPWLIAGRIVQGIGGGILTPVGLAMLYRAYPREERARVTATTALLTGLAPILGPVVGGALVARLSWRWVFLVNVPLGVLAIVLCALLVKGAYRAPARRLDIVGLLLATVGLGGVVYGLTSLSEGGAPLLSGASAVAGMVLVALLVPWSDGCGILSSASTSCAPRRSDGWRS